MITVSSKYFDRSEDLCTFLNSRPYAQVVSIVSHKDKFVLFYKEEDL